MEKIDFLIAKKLKKLKSYKCVWQLKQNKKREYNGYIIPTSNIVMFSWDDLNKIKNKQKQ